ncbi:hypothetical protein [Acetonema longum]|uniref:Uncharacterized protein n=1 Tax=Acetonema longum DSM 6540 TaxID=1009370 RepID=F7NFK2_9FIRM|nr:hypothetical protein [Acetonema longum]EGO65201.1 hypothetical protein ALO_04146 [Acetonema longum DSM 6540]
MLTWHEVFPIQPAVITVVGMAKNVGKTVTLNYLQKILHNEGYVFGLTSIGRDGETFDALTNLEKPRIEAQPGTIVATAEKMIADIREWELLQHTDLATPLGKVLILRARDFNRVVLAGPSKNSDVKELLSYFAALGAGCTLIDGAFDRQSSADPLISSQVLLACGATVSRDLMELIFLAQSRVTQLTLPACEAMYRNIARTYQGQVITVLADTVREVSLHTSLLRPAEWSELFDAGCDAVIIKGAVSDSLAQALLWQRRPPAVIVQDGSKVFITAALWRQLQVRQVRFTAVHPICLLGVTINPTYPGGQGFDAEVLLQEMGKALAPVPVFDCLREAKYKEVPL